MKDLIERYRKLYSGVIYDALTLDLRHTRPFVVDRGIGRICRASIKPMVGPAFPVRGRSYRGCNAVSQLGARQAQMFDKGSEGDVLVMDTGGDSVVAHFGDMSALLGRRAKFAGCVIDGYTRDVDRMMAMGVTLFARGATPQDSLSDWSIDDINCVVELPGTTGVVSIYPGDLIFADGDGVLAIPRLCLAELLEKAELLAANERDMVRAIQAGKLAVDVFKEFGKW